MKCRVVCAKKRQKRPWTARKLGQVVDDAVRESGCEDVAEAVETAMDAAGCNGPHKKYRKTNQQRQVRDMQIKLELSIGRLAALLAAASLVGCLGEDDRVVIRDAQRLLDGDLRKAVAPILTGDAFTTGGKFGGTAFVTGGRIPAGGWFTGGRF